MLGATNTVGEFRLDHQLPPETSPDGLLPLRAILADVEHRTIRRVLLACKGNRTKMAEMLGISRRLLFDKIREYDLRP